jgi:hypothetical protein
MVHADSRQRLRAKPGFDPRPLHMRFVVDKVAKGQDSSPSTSFVSCQCHSINAPYSSLS